MNQQQVSQVTMGAVVTIVGLLLLAGQLDLSHDWHFGRLWPVIFLVIGATRVMGGSDRRSAWSGWWFLFLGVLFLLHTYRVMRLDQSWPLFIVWAGVSILFRRRDRDAAPPAQPPTNESGRLS